MSEPLTPEREAEIREWVEAMGKQKDIRYYGSWQQHGELLGEIDRLRAELAKYVGKEPTIAEEMAYISRCLHAVHDLCDKAEQQAKRWEHALPVPAWVEPVRKAADGIEPASGPRPALPWAHTMDDSDLSMFLSDLVSAALYHWHQDPEVPPREVLRLIEKACANWRTPGQGLRSDEPTDSPWERAVHGLNALVDAGVPFHIEPDGHISNALGDEHIEWDREVGRWRFVVDGPEPVEVEDPCHPCGCPKRFNRHAEGCTARSSEGGDVHA